MSYSKDVHRLQLLADGLRRELRQAQHMTPESEDCTPEELAEYVDNLRDRFKQAREELRTWMAHLNRPMGEDWMLDATL